MHLKTQLSRSRSKRSATRHSTSRVAISVGALAIALGACGSDSSGTSGTVEGAPEGARSAYTEAVATSESHDEILLSTGGDMVVAVNCDAQTGGDLVTVVAVGLPPGTYTGTFDPAAGGDLSLQVTGAGEAVGARQTTLDEAEYTVTFADIDGGVTFTLAGCSS